VQRLPSLKIGVVLALILALGSVMLVATPVQAQYSVPAGIPAKNLQDSGSQPLPSGVTPDVTVKTRAYLSFRPNPVGKNQIFLVNMWLTPALHASRYFKNYKVTIQKPSGKTEVVTMDSYRADTTAWFEYIADEVGVWKLKFEFPGGYFPAGNYSTEKGAVMYGQPTNFSFPLSCYYLPSSTEWQELIVQEDMVYSWPCSPLPTDYWTRPISLENREWWWIAGHFPWRGPGIGDPNWPANTNKYWANGDRYRFIPWVEAPETAHIAWKRQGAIGGLIGPIDGSQKVEAWTSGGGSPTIIYAGRCYQTVTEADVAYNKPTTRTYWMCYDLRTGEVYWKRPLYSGESAPSVIWYSPGYPEVPGGEPRFQKAVWLMSIVSGRMIGYDPWNGAVALNFSISPLTTGTYYRNGYWLTVRDLGAAAGAQRYRLINWTIDIIPGAWPYGTTTFKAKIVDNKTWPWSSLGTTWDLESGIAVSTSPITPIGVGAWYGTWVAAASLKTGQQLYNKTYEETMYSMMAALADHGKFAFTTMEGYWLGINLADGSIAWKSDMMDYPWDSPGFGAYGTASAYGLFYRFAYSGIYAFNWTNGKMVWKYEAPANPYETPYVNPNGTTVYSFNAAGWIADGKLYAYNTEHTPTQPITRGWRLHCINATTGKGIWNITGSMVPGAIADGYLVASNTYDGYTYCFGKGKSKTSVEVSQDVVAKGSTVLVKGSVLDMSPAQPGTPCVAKESMTVWMEYLHMQKPCPSDVKGVPVVLTAIKSDGKVIDLGTVTTNGFYGTFGFAWTPEEEGIYTIIASFAGDDSYGSSSAATLITVGPAPPEPETPEYPTPTDYTPMFAGIIVAVAIAIVIGIVNLYALRKHK